MKNFRLILVGALLATTFIFTTAQDGAAPSQSYGGSIEVERLASRMERFMKMHVEVVRNQMQLNTALHKLTLLQIENAKNGRFAHISDSTYFDTRTAEIFKRPAP
jgi:succinate dehydrogenase/fumarate reductase flavoprotein subunit